MLIGRFIFALGGENQSVAQSNNSDINKLLFLF